MAIRDTAAQRLYVAHPLAAGAECPLTRDQVGYLRNVLRLESGARVLAFNGRDGEWRTRLLTRGKREAVLAAEEQVRPQARGPDVRYLFAPLKRARLDYMVQKAVELGVARLSPVLTRRTIAERVNIERMRANAIEAAEQCGILWLPAIDEPSRLDAAILDLEPGRRLIICDEAAEVTSPIAALGALTPASPVAVLIGPEGGFAPEERERLRAHRDALAISLGPRVMRADTAAVAALALVNATLGDWR